MLLLLFELVFHIGVCLLAVTSESRAAPAVSEVQIPFTSGPCVLETEGTLRWNHEKQVIEACNGAEWVGVGVLGYSYRLGATKAFPAVSCKEIKQQVPTVKNGVYWIQPPESRSPFQAYCDMQTDGGGWMLLYAYKHNRGTKYDLVTALPTSPDGYSHQLLNNLGISAGWAQELRFYCTTSLHNRVVHFKTNNKHIIQTAYDGKKHFSVSDWSSSALTEKLTGHTAYLPHATDRIWAVTHQTAGLTDFPFYRLNAYHWGIAPNWGPGRFECDDYANNYNYDTLHRVFVRD